MSDFPRPRAVLSVLACCGLAAQGCIMIQEGSTLEPDPVTLSHRVASRVAVVSLEPPNFDWGEGILASGMIRVGASTRTPLGFSFARSWGDRWRSALGPLLDERGYSGRWGPAFALVQLFEARGDQLDLDAADRVGDFIDRRATRTLEGALGHWRDNRQLWIDTLYMTSPLLAALGQLKSRPDRTRDAVRQVRLFAEHLRDPRTGLFRHMWDDETNGGADVLWARGNGWAAMSYIEVLRRLEPGSPEHADLRQGLAHLLDAIAAAQDRRSGLWHTVLDRPDTYLETSASAMFLFAFAEGERLGLIPRTHRELILRAWKGLAERVDDSGRVLGTSAGTMPGDFARYASALVGEYPWGTGAFLLAAGAVADWR
jgi:unsaturated rhamnogalacturonyl hydrolase